jgi:nicotinate-nucleotide adenylyltransferase
LTTIGVFGGTFDPVHIGHLRTCVELRGSLDLAEIHMIPCARPPHRSSPVATAEQRLAMLRRAIINEPCLLADDREIRRTGPSYTVDTLRELRVAAGKRAIYFCIGMDSLLSLDSWHRWRELTDFAHLVVVARPGWNLPVQGPVADWLADKLVGDVEPADIQLTAKEPCGQVLIRKMIPLPIESTRLREDLANGRSVRYLIPDGVLDYIQEHRLYQTVSL